MADRKEDTTDIREITFDKVFPLFPRGEHTTRTLRDFDGVGLPFFRSRVSLDTGLLPRPILFGVGTGAKPLADIEAFTPFDEGTDYPISSEDGSLNSRYQKHLNLAPGQKSISMQHSPLFIRIDSAPFEKLDEGEMALDRVRKMNEWLSPYIDICRLFRFELSFPILGKVFVSEPDPMFLDRSFGGYLVFRHFFPPDFPMAEGRITGFRDLPGVDFHKGLDVHLPTDERLEQAIADAHGKFYFSKEAYLRSFL